MSVLSPERWHAIEPHLDRAMDLDEGERRAFLEELRSREPGAAADLESILAEQAEVSSKRFLEGAPPQPPPPPSLMG